MNILRVIPIIFVTVLTSGCLHKEALHTLYLSPDGGIRWVAVESDVFSDAEDPGQRFAEEQAFIGAALLGGHTTALGLKALKPDSLVDTLVVRDERPFQVITQARYTRIDRLFDQLLDGTGVRGKSSLTTEDGLSTLLVRLDFRHEVREDRTDVVKMLEEATHLRIVLTEGRFRRSPDADITGDVQATVSDDWLKRANAAREARQSIDLRLMWSVSGDGS